MKLSRTEILSPFYGDERGLTRVIPPFAVRRGPFVVRLCASRDVAQINAGMARLEIVNDWMCRRQNLLLIFSTTCRSKDATTAHLKQEREKPVVFLTARVHPGESPASFICHGVIDFLVSQHPIAQVLRDHVVFKIVPMLNPDGVYLGNYRCSLMGFDLNRHWQDPSPWAHPTLHAVKQLIVQMNQDPEEKRREKRVSGLDRCVRCRFYEEPADEGRADGLQGENAFPITTVLSDSFNFFNRLRRENKLFERVESVVSSFRRAVDGDCTFLSRMPFMSCTRIIEFEDCEGYRFFFTLKGRERLLENEALAENFIPALNYVVSRAKQANEPCLRNMVLHACSAITRDVNLSISLSNRKGQNCVCLHVHYCDSHSLTHTRFYTHAQRHVKQHPSTRQYLVPLDSVIVLQHKTTHECLSHHLAKRRLNDVAAMMETKVSLEFYIDVHAHSTMMNGFMYGNVFEEEERVQRQAVFPRLLCHNAPDFSLSSTTFNRDMVKAGTGRRFLGGLLDDTSYCYTLEVSFYSYLTAGRTSPVPYTEDGCILYTNFVQM
ncbi:Cytosolic carboxypeptidase 6 [Triplophysa tibetana]|uniref:Cytosolic carboxypeptidase 6 n=1 Tax=Triplophysa tibetana TaxID=1572043 RepID=A0A5A9NVH9_9TELE|nr:Cytosolic carboxypeptidase 6 [Triplophysa tibetana]